MNNFGGFLQTHSENIMSVLMITGLGFILTLMGTKVTPAEIKNTITTKGAKIALITCHHYIVTPLIAIIISLLAKLNEPRSMALYLLSVTPPTVAASVTTFASGGDIALSLTSSVVSLVCSFIFMPAVFWIQVKTTRPKGIADLKLPYLEMTGILAFLVIAKLFGVLLKIKYDENLIKIRKCLKYSGIGLLVSSIPFFIISKNLVQFSFYGGPQWKQHYIASTLMIVLSTLSAYATSYHFKDHKEKIAIIMTVLRKNPAIPISVAALSFKESLGPNAYAKAFGMVFIAAPITDLCTLPLLIFYRRINKKTPNNEHTNRI